MKKLFCAAIALLITATAAIARPAPPPRGAAPMRSAPSSGAKVPPPPRPPVRQWHRPPPPPRFYYRYHRHHRHDWFASGLGLGVIIGVLSGKDNYNAPHDYARRADEVRRAARETAERQSSHLVKIISRIGSEEALFELSEYWQAQGQSTALVTNDPIRTLRVMGFQNDLIILYRLDRAAREETVTVTAPLYNVSESAGAVYTEPEGTEQVFLSDSRESAQSDAKSSEVEVKEAFRHLGFTLDQNARTSEGYLIIQSVTPATAAAYAGLKKGAVLRSIDGNTTAQVNVPQLCAFIVRRAAAGAVVKIACSEGENEKTIEIQL